MTTKHLQYNNRAWGKIVTRGEKVSRICYKHSERVRSFLSTRWVSIKQTKNVQDKKKIR